MDKALGLPKFLSDVMDEIFVPWMSFGISENQIVEMTVNLRKACCKERRSRRAVETVKKLKRFLRKHFHDESRVVISHELNGYIFSCGRMKVPPKVRVRVKKEIDVQNAEKNILNVNLVVVGSFKGLKEIVVSE